MRYDDIKKQYTKLGGAWNDQNEMFSVGKQMQFEWEQDFNAMKWALERIDDFLQVAKKNGYFTGTLYIAKDELLKRISEYSCPSLLKDEHKTKDRCILKDGCKCFNDTK